ncbi:SDR family NAD(P)-dependent oxidoreductase [Brumicola blandensis]|uniref:SDR family oxidoreductase n=1 Tax=Brumicola blandensis TaxID=3075611 RepID=A0AAW8R3Q0_9ALTE|nr:SDR family NAD(P)-dependent oxidoreductase [Alteromonas sp. W409]MDT0581773.1 SDR family oxidoreductase [Alteromonas sp. W409]
MTTEQTANADLGIAIVTGACSGLGHASAVVLANAGYKLAIFDLNEEVGQQRVQEFGADRCQFYKVDVTNDESVEKAVSDVAAGKDEIRLCVNCAGVAPAKRTLDREGEAMPLANFKTVIDINLVGTFNVARVVASAMAKNTPKGEAQQRGLIVNTASVAGYEGQIGQTAYAASKGGIIGLCLPMARDLAPLGIRVNTIAPGVMGTPMLLAMPDKVQDALVHNVQFPKRLGLPEEFGKLVLHMSENAYLNGETVRLDGALRMPPK